MRGMAWSVVRFFSPPNAQNLHLQPGNPNPTKKDRHLQPGKQNPAKKIAVYSLENKIQPKKIVVYSLENKIQQKRSPFTAWKTKSSKKDRRLQPGKQNPTKKDRRLQPGNPNPTKKDRRLQPGKQNPAKKGVGSGKWEVEKAPPTRRPKALTLMNCERAVRRRRAALSQFGGRGGTGPPTHKKKSLSMGGFEDAFGLAVAWFDGECAASGADSARDLSYFECEFAFAEGQIELPCGGLGSEGAEFEEQC